MSLQKTLDPDENKNLFYAAEPLRNKVRQRIFSLLISRNNLSFNELMNHLNISRQKLAYHLQILTNYDIIRNFYDKRSGNKDHSFYELSAFGRELTTGISILRQKQNLQSLDQYIDDKDEKEKISPSANFRTLNQVNYKSYERYLLKHSPTKMQPIEKNLTDYTDPWLDCDILNRRASSISENKISLPTPRQHFLAYKKSFKIIKKVKYQY